MSENITIIGIESSCDDTSAAVIRDGVLLSNVIAGQAVHTRYGGVVPELASRAHQQNIIPVVHDAMLQAGIDRKDLTAIAFTRGPGSGFAVGGFFFCQGIVAIARCSACGCQSSAGTRTGSFYQSGS